ncbi:MAG TPA: tRNA (adenosine(37)-N6)-dimethylallyltransferase MiaA [Gemmatimonadales bacterium]|nr:tRNA (adenosine(37)-N6)-dimethylallyltransferase MiaA [Gemmatimonadales bacterium]
MAVARVPVLVGPTGIGKTAVALALARHWPLEVVSADSRQVYRRLDIATAKPTIREQARVPHHGLDLISPGERYSAGRFARDASGSVAEVIGRGRLPVVVGGTGLYVRALAEGLFHEPALDQEKRRLLDAWLARLDPLELVRWAGRLDPGFAGGGRQRAQRAIEIALLTGRALTHWQRAARAARSIDPWYVVLSAPRAVLHRRIEQRAREMVQRGLLGEVAAVLADGARPGTPGLDGVGVREAVDVLTGRRAQERLVEDILVSTRQYAKRQETWFRHQLTGERITLDATRGPETVAAEIADLWARAQT